MAVVLLLPFAVSPLTSFKASFVSNILAISPESQLTALDTKLEMVASPLDAHAGRMLSAMPPKAEATASKAEPMPFAIHSKALQIPSITAPTTERSCAAPLIKNPKYCKTAEITTAATAPKATKTGFKPVRTVLNKLPTAAKADCKALPASDNSSVLTPIV